MHLASKVHQNQHRSKGALKYKLASQSAIFPNIIPPDIEAETYSILLIQWQLKSLYLDFSRHFWPQCPNKFVFVKRPKWPKNDSITGL